MLSGKTAERALRADFLVQNVLVSHILEEIMKEESIHLTEVKKIYLKSLEKGMSREELRNLRDDTDLKLVEEKT